MKYLILIFLMGCYSQRALNFDPYRPIEEMECTLEGIKEANESCDLDASHFCAQWPTYTSLCNACYYLVKCDI